MNEQKLENLSNASGTSLNDNVKQHPGIKRTKSFKAVSKLAFIRKPKLAPKTGNSFLLNSIKRFNLVMRLTFLGHKTKRNEKIRPPDKPKPTGLHQTKIYYLPLIPTEEDEKNVIIKNFLNIY